jgi:hypothetical protein
METTKLPLLEEVLGLIERFERDLGTYRGDDLPGSVLGFPLAILAWRCSTSYLVWIMRSRIALSFDFGIAIMAIPLGIEFPGPLDHVIA